MAGYARIAELSGARGPLHARVAGRITGVEGTRARVEDASGVAPVGLGACKPPPLGAWVFVDGTWHDGAIAASRIDVVRAPRGEFPRVHGDWVWFHEDGRRHLRMLQLRAAMVRALRAFFDDRGFLEVDTPVLVASPALDHHVDAFELTGTRERRWLATSPEHEMKRLLVAGLDRIYQIARCFRRGERGALHQPEFTALEWYRSFAGSPAVMQDAEQLVASVARAIFGTTRVVLRGGVIDVTPPWPRMTVSEALARHAALTLDEILPDEDELFFLFATEVVPRLGHDRPVFLTEWPPSTAPLAKAMRHRGDRADRFEAILGGVEICNGCGELDDPIELRVRLEREHAAHAVRDGVRHPIDERLVAALEEGLPPSAGCALGVDRLAMLMLGAARVDDVVAFSDVRA